MNFARFPWPQVVYNENGATVTIRDLRFQSARMRRSGFAIQIQLDRELHVRDQEFSFSGKFQSN